MKRIDAHMHFWTLALEQHYCWLSPELTALYRDYSPADALPLAKESGIDGCVLIAAADDVKETAYLLGMADANDFIKGVVVWLDMLAPDAPAQLRMWARFKKLKGIRPYLQDIPQDDWMLKPQLEPVLQVVEELGLTFDILIYPRHLLIAGEFIKRHPKLKVVIDHMAKPVIRNGEIETWRHSIAAVAAIPHVHCKMSGILTEDGPQWTAQGIRPYLDTVLTLFGPERILFGSDWPVVNLVANYGKWIKLVEDVTMHLSEPDRAKIFGGNAIRFYNLNTG